MSHAPNTDFHTINKVYRERLGGNPFGIEPDPPIKPLSYCSFTGCVRVFNPNDGTARGDCTGACYADCY